MTDREQVITQALLEALGELEATWPDLKIERSPEALLIGAGSPLDSTSFLAVMVAAEERIEAVLGEQVSLMDLLDGEEIERLTVGDLARRAAKSPSGGQPVAG